MNAISELVHAAALRSCRLWQGLPQEDTSVMPYLDLRLGFSDQSQILLGIEELAKSSQHN